MSRSFFQRSQNHPNLGRVDSELFPNSSNQTFFLNGLSRKSLRHSSGQTQRHAALSAIAGDGLSRKEKKLVQLINRYRRKHDLPKIKLSKALTIVANRHVRDLELHGVHGSLHAWSDAPYDADKPKTYSSMWLAPQRLGTGYPGYGYENAYSVSGGNASARRAFNGWKNSPEHNATLLNLDLWGDIQWNALGVGIYQGFAVLWLGEEPDPTGKPARE